MVRGVLGIEKVCFVFLMRCTSAESGCSFSPSIPITKSLSDWSRPWQARRMSVAYFASPYARPIEPCSMRISRCSAASACSNFPERRSGYQIAHLFSGFVALRIGLSNRHSLRSCS